MTGFCGSTTFQSSNMITDHDFMFAGQTLRNGQQIFTDGSLGWVIHRTILLKDGVFVDTLGHLVLCHPGDNP